MKLIRPTRRGLILGAASLIAAPSIVRAGSLTLLGAGGAGGGGGGGGFPSTLSGLIGWWNAQVTASINLTGSSVNSWADQSGANNHLLWTANGKPNYGATSFNGKPGIQTTAVSTSPNFASLVATPFAMGTGNTLTAWWVGNFDFGTSQGSARLLSYAAPAVNDNDNVGSWTTYSKASDPNAHGISRNSVSTLFGPVINDANSRVIITIDSSGNETMYVNGAATTLNTVAGNWVSGGTFSIGRAAQGGAYSQTIYGEAGVATSFNNSTTIGLLDTDIKTRWNL